MNSDLDEDTDVTFEDGGTWVNTLGELSNWKKEFIHSGTKYSFLPMIT